MCELAQRIDISDVGLRNILKTNRIPLPRQGHWNRVHAGRQIQAAPRPRPRRAGESGRVRLDGRFRGHVPEGARMPIEGPFASEYVPEDLEELFAIELKAIGKVSVPRALGRPHRGLHRLLKKDEKRRQKFAETGWDWDRPGHDNPLALRQLRIANAILKALSARGHDGDLSASEDGYVLGADIGDTGVELLIAREDKVRFTSKELRGLPPATRLSVSLQGRKGEEPKAWIDEKGNRVEKQVAPIVAATIVAGEARFRQGLVDAAKFEEQQRKWKEEARAREIERAEQQRLSDLRQSGELLRQAREIRELVTRVGEAITGNASSEITPEQLDAWKRWALAHADALDPVLSGQVKNHLYVPALYDED